MSQYKVSVKKLLLGVLNRPEGLVKLVKVVLDQALEAQMTEHLAAAPDDRSPSVKVTAMACVFARSTPAWDP